MAQMVSIQRYSEICQAIDITDHIREAVEHGHWQQADRGIKKRQKLLDQVFAHTSQEQPLTAKELEMLKGLLQQNDALLARTDELHKTAAASVIDFKGKRKNIRAYQDAKGL